MFRLPVKQFLGRSLSQAQGAFQFEIFSSVLLLLMSVIDPIGRIRSEALGFAVCRADGRPWSGSQFDTRT